jgi:hypothetical protein
MADIQAEGLRAAGDLLERVLGSESGPPAARAASPASEYQAFVDAWIEVLRQTFAGLAQPPAGETLTVPVEPNGIGPPLRLAMGPASETRGRSAEVWLHNGSGSAVGPVAFRCGELSDAQGELLAGVEVRFDPAEVEVMPPRSSRAVTVSLAGDGLAGEGPPGVGTYRGTIQARGAPGVWLPLEVVVEC